MTFYSTEAFTTDRKSFHKLVLSFQWIELYEEGNLTRVRNNTQRIETLIHKSDLSSALMRLHTFNAVE